MQQRHIADNRGRSPFNLSPFHSSRGRIRMACWFRPVGAGGM